MLVLLQEHHTGFSPFWGCLQLLRAESVTVVPRTGYMRLGIQLHNFISCPSAVLWCGYRSIRSNSSVRHIDTKGLSTFPLYSHRGWPTGWPSSHQRPPPINTLPSVDEIYEDGNASPAAAATGRDSRVKRVANGYC